MARFIADIKGQRGRASRLGTLSSGITAHPRGWKLGVQVCGYAGECGDTFEVRATGGSGASWSIPIATVYEGDNQQRRIRLFGEDGKEIADFALKV